MQLAPTLLSFVLSFVYVAIYWNNHHHFFQLVPHGGGGDGGQSEPAVLAVADFYISVHHRLVDEQGSAQVPIAVYGATLRNEARIPRVPAESAEIAVRRRFYPGKAGANQVAQHRLILGSVRRVGGNSPDASFRRSARPRRLEFHNRA